MKQFETAKIRNVCLLSHGGAGKTSLTEAMLFTTGAIDRLGKVTEGTTATDFDPEEIKRNISVGSALAPVEWRDVKINIIDTPGYFDFVGEVMQGIRVADAAVILASAKSGVSVGTENAWKYAEDAKISRMFFVSKIDEENADFFKVFDQLKSTFGKSVVPFELPIKEGDKVVGLVDVVHMKAKKFDGKTQTEIDIPDNMLQIVTPIREQLVESAAETSDELMEKFFAGAEFTGEEISQALRLGVEQRLIVPVLWGSATELIGIKTLLDEIVDFFPSPQEAKKEVAKTVDKDEDIELNCDENKPLAALVFKTVADPYVGKLSYFKVFSGKVTPDVTVLNTNTGENEKIGHIYIIRGKKQIETDKVAAGDIGAVTKLINTNTGDTLCAPSNKVLLSGITFSKPSISLAIVPKAKGDEEKISAGLHKLVEEDPTFKVENNLETHQLLISGIGEQHLEVIVSKLKAKFGVSVELTEPKVPYRETIKKKVRVEGKHKKQSGGHGQYGHVWIEFEHGDSEDLTFEEKVFGGAVPRNYFPAVEKGLRESILHGVLAGYPVVNLKATLVDGSYHPVDSSEMAFKIAAHVAYKKGLEEAGCALLEPLAHMEVIVPDTCMGDIIGDINKRRGRILGMNPQDGGMQEVVAEVPLAEVHKYATDLRSMTQGRGKFTLAFDRYEEAAMNVAQKVIEEAKKNMKSEE